jgi:hypothetical protein
MKTTYPEIKHIHHDTSLSSFATGLFIGTLATLMLATEEGRAAGKKLMDAIRETSKDLAPELDKLPEHLTKTVNMLEKDIDEGFNPLDHLHRGSTPSGSTFHRGGEPLK